MKTPLFLFLLFQCSFLISQDNSVKNDLIRSIAKYRQTLMEGDEESLLQLNKTIRAWKAVEPDAKAGTEFISAIQYAGAIFDLNANVILNSMLLAIPEEKLVNVATEEQVNSIVQNSQLLDLIDMGVVNEEYPHQIHNNKHLYDEIEFYDLTENESIADIGAGKGVMSLLFYLANQSNKIYVNEIDTDLIKYIEHYLAKGNLNKSSSELFVVKRTNKKINLPEKVDKIIIRKTFHHFKKKEKMLKSIRNSLKQNGRLFITEIPFRAEDVHACHLSMEESRIKSIVNNNGFKLERETWIGEQLLLEYSLRN